MIDVTEALKDLPHFDKFCSVSDLYKVVESLSNDARFEVKDAGASVNGLPIHHIRFGKGSIRALFVAFPHCKEPIGGLTVYSLISALQAGKQTLVEADVEWNIVPCIDPDGALLNESWTQAPFDMKTYMKNFYVQARDEQVDDTFRINHKTLVFNNQSKESLVLKAVMDEVRPHFHYTLHNAWAGGAFYFISRDIGQKYHNKLYELLGDIHFPLQKHTMWPGVCEQFGEGIAKTFSNKKHYDYLETTTEAPARFFGFGGGSWDYMEEIMPDGITMLTEVGYFRHPSDESDFNTGENLRKFKLRVDADCKYLGSILLEEWNKVKYDVDTKNPIYNAVMRGAVVPRREDLIKGGRPMSMFPSEDILFNPQFARAMTEADRFQAIIVESGFWFLCQSYQIVRLLKASPQTPAIRQAIERLEQAFDDALANIELYVDFDAFEAFELDALARVQLGSGLVVLNFLMEERERSARERGRYLA